MRSPSTSLSGSTLNDSASSSQDDAENKTAPPTAKVVRDNPTTELEARCHNRRREDAARYLRFVHHAVDDTIQRDIATLNTAATEKEAEWAEKRKARELADRSKADKRRAKRREANRIRRKRRMLERIALKAGEIKTAGTMCDKLRETTPDPKERIVLWVSAIPANANPSIAPKFRK